jgi:hypothetical protein
MANQTESAVARAGGLRQLAVPAAVGLAGTAVAVILTRKPKLAEVVSKLRGVMPEARPPGIGEITDDLKRRLDSVLGKGGGAGEEQAGVEDETPSDFDTSESERRRRERGERRERRRRGAA